MRYFIVNQGKTFANESKGNYIWAPITNKKGQHFLHWENLTKIEKGDVIFSNYKGNILSVNIAKGKCYECNNPFNGDDWDNLGRKVDLDYHYLTKPIVYNTYLNILLELQPKSGAFNKRMINLGYLFELTKGQFEFICSLITDNEIHDLFNQHHEQDARNELLDIIEDEEQFKNIHLGKIKPYNMKELEALKKQHKNDMPSQYSACSKRIKTDAKLKATCLELAGYQCEVIKDHKTFSNTTGIHQYVECHHLIPVKAQSDFKNLWLDDLFNLICLCPLCHAQFHYGDRQAKEEVFWKMFNKHEKCFKENGITKETIEQIFNKYYF